MGSQTKALERYKGNVYDVGKDKYAILKPGAISDLNCIVENFDVKNIRFTMGDGCRIELQKIQDEDALPGENVDTFA